MIPRAKPRAKHFVSEFVIGTQSRKIWLKKDGQLKVEVSVAQEEGEAEAGFKSLPNYLDSDAIKQCLKIYDMMLKHQMTFNQVIVRILTELDVPERKIHMYADSSKMHPFNQVFELLAKTLKVKLQAQIFSCITKKKIFGFESQINQKKPMSVMSAKIGLGIMNKFGKKFSLDALGTKK